MEPYQPRTQPLVALMSFLGALVAAFTIVVLFADVRAIFKIAALAGLTFPLVVILSGNPRLFFLMGLILTAPLGLSINFMRLIHIGGSPSYSIELVDFFILPLLIFLVRDLAFGYRNKIRVPGIVWWWVGLIVIGLIHIGLGPFRHLPGYETMRMIKSLVLFIVIVNECVRIRQFEYLIVALGAGILLQVGIACLQFVLKQDLGLQALGEAGAASTKGANLGVYGTSGVVYRIGGLMGHPNLLSAYLALLLPIFFALLFCNYNRFVKFLISVVILGGGLALLITLSRAGWLSFGVAYLLVMVIVAIDPWLRTKHLALKGFVVVFTLVIALAASGPVIKRLTQSHEGAVEFRFEWMQVALEMVAAKPLLGFGLNTFVYHMAPFTSYGGAAALTDKFGKVWPPVHNIYLLVWSEQGSLGFFLFLGFHIQLLRMAIKNLRYYLDDRLHAINIGALCGLVAIMIDGMASFFIRVPAPNRVFWIVVALIVAINIWNRVNYSHRFNLQLRGQKLPE